VPTPQPSPHAGRVRCSTPVDGGGYTNRRAKVHKKQQLTTPLLQVPPASKGEPTPCAVPLAKRGEPTEGGNCELWRAVGISRPRLLCLLPSAGGRGRMRRWANRRSPLSRAEIVQGERRSPLHPPFCGRGAGGEGKHFRTAAPRPTWRPARVLSRTCRLAPSRRRSPPGARARSASSSPRRSVF